MSFSFRIFRVALLFICQGAFILFQYHLVFLKIPSGEDGIWTHAPLLTTYSLSRGAPSANLGTSPNGRNKSGEGGIRTHVPLRTNGFQDRLVMTTSIPLHILFCYRPNPQCKNHSIKSSLLCQLFFNSFLWKFLSYYSSNLFSSATCFILSRIYAVVNTFLYIF